VSDYPGEHPEPAVDLGSRAPLLFSLDTGIVLYRIHDRSQEPVFFGRTGRSRFDSPDGKFGVLYVARDEYCAFIETFGQATGVSAVTRKALEERPLSCLTLKTSLKLIDLSDSGGLARIDADGRLFSGSHAVAQRWSAALRSHPTKPAGLLYRARHDPARNACALFDLPQSALVITDTGSLLDSKHAVLLPTILDRYDFGLIE
jgi:hypothetical protein